MMNLSSHENLLHINKSWITVFQCDTLYMKTKVLYACCALTSYEHLFTCIRSIPLLPEFQFLILFF